MLRQFSARNLLGLIRLIFLKLKYRSRVSGFFFIGAGPRIFIGKQGSLSVGQGTIIIEDFVIRAEAPVEIGKDVFFNRGCHVVAKSGISIGDRSLFGEYVSIHDEAHAIQGGKIVGRNDFIARPITIGSDVWVGAKATILPGVTIGDRAIIGANAVVSKDVEPGVVVGGIPARFIKKVTDNYAGASELDIRRNSSSRPRD